MIGIEYHADLKEVQGDGALARLLGEHARAPFDRLAWWEGLEAECGLRPLLAVAREGDAMAVLPLQGGSGHLQALGNWYNFIVRPLLTAGSEPLLAALARDLRRKAWRITLAPMPDEDGSASMQATAFKAAGWTVLRQQCDVNHILPVGGRSYADYLASRPGPLRTTLKRKGGKVETLIYQQFDEPSWQDYEAVYRSSWKPSEGSPAFLRRFAEAEGAAGRLRLGIARHEGAPVAAQLWTVEHGIAYIHKLAHIEESKPLSPGTTLSAALFAHVIDHDRVALVDFGTGDDGYKRDWMETVRPRYRLDMFNPRNPRSWSHLAKAALRRLAPGRSHG
ncbi:MAG TPA: GNAT family N-acetyltransferase [Novosphingobium sp.]|nr:GNAT family N-acetyltransferase [Novosphingobium sp.]